MSRFGRQCCFGLYKEDRCPNNGMRRSNTEAMSPQNAAAVRTARLVR